MAKTKRLLVLEDCVHMGSAGQQLAAALAAEAGGDRWGFGCKTWAPQFVEHGAVSQLREPPRPLTARVGGAEGSCPCARKDMKKE
ncbi:MAG: hypothetical protein ACOX0U_04665 [Oscillospiraceae bacterium]